ncbi:MAG: chemotaxis protein CheB [Micropepsaceae bacterium]
MSKGIFDGSSPLVVGIGASAGGLQAFKKFFVEMPAENGMAFVLVQHLDPAHESLLVNLIGSQTKMRVVEAWDGAKLVANSIFVIPPDATLTIESGVLRMRKPAPPRELRHPIDTFFLSLAEDQGPNAVCIVLSGMGSDGSIGLKAVKENGGLTLAQAEFDHHAMSGMPDSAAATGQVDLVLPVESMAARLIAHRAYLIEASQHKDTNGERTDMAEHLTVISEILKRAVGQDFGQYKESTVLRRVQRRMQVLQISSVSEFIARMEKEPREAEALFREILIGVTQFFRDPAAFEALRKDVVNKLIASKTPGDQIRVWVAGCATGEEAYSIAMLFREATEGLKDAPRIQIFGSDIDDRAIVRARSGRFRAPLQGVSPERQSKWFVAVDGEFCVAKEIREMCVFSTHSLIKDPPFSKLDLVSCRNVMIYFDRVLQDRVLHNFHYALGPGGFLFLGSSEGVTRNATLFSTVDKKCRIFEWCRTAGASLPEFPLLATGRSKREAAGSGLEDPIEKCAQRIVSRFSPAYVVVDRNFQVVRFSGGDVGQYLEPSAGVASLDLFSILRKSLRPTIRSAVRLALRKREAVVSDCINDIGGGKKRPVVVVVEPLAKEGPESDLCLVAFRDAAGSTSSNGAARPASVNDAVVGGSQLAELERELAVAKSSLREAVDELETTSEEMKSSNEEFQSVNEELQASNEELETAKEEMQSINEELRTVNSEMQDKNAQLMRLNGDLRNLLDSTQIATIFLDRDLRIKSFTPGMTELIHLRESDLGRPVTELVSRLNYDGLEQDVKSVLVTLDMIEREVRIGNEGAGSVLLMRIRPYRTVKNVVDGVVVTFFDITSQKLLENALTESERRLSAIINQAAAGVAETDFKGTFTLCNPLFCRLTGRTKTELKALRIQDITHPGDWPRYSILFEQLLKDGPGFDVDARYIRPDGSVIWVRNSVSSIAGAAGHASRVLSVVVDITEHKFAESHRELLLHELSHRVKNTLAIVQSIAMQTSPGATSVEAYRAAFLSRLMSLARTHNLLQTSDWQGALLRDVVMCELAPFKTDALRWTVDGTDVLLDANTALALGMAIHELSTNAAKYGALSGSVGHVAVGWTLTSCDGRRLLKLVWTESGGPSVVASRRKGFGTRLISEGLALQLDGKIRHEFEPSGVECTIEIFLPDVAGRE